MDLLKQKIIEKIKAEGPIPFEVFMDIALYYPELGYYSSPGTQIGKEGDYYTSPHLHPIFGAMIGKQFIEMWTCMGKPQNFYAVEMGAGAGYLCKDIHDYLNTPSVKSDLSLEKAAFLGSLNYVIVEPYPHFQQKQKTLLEHFSGGWPLSSPPGEEGGASVNGNIKWVTSLNELNPGINGCFFSNELLDAFPVHIVEMENEFKEIYVDYDGSEFVEEKNKITSEEITGYIQRYIPGLHKGYRTEINIKAKKWLEDISALLSHGFLLTIDYGHSAQAYYHEERSGGTLLCYHKHQINDNPYDNIGEQDITAHINFSSLKQWGEELGLKTIGCCPQGTFLTSSGIDEVIIELYAHSPDYLAEISRIKGLILPHGMGESHSVMIQYRGYGLPELRGFSMRNQADSL